MKCCGYNSNVQIFVFCSTCRRWWIYFLLFGSINCFPLPQGGLSSFGDEDSMLPYLAFSSEQAAPQQSTGQSIQTGTYSSDPAQYYSGAANPVGGESYSNYGLQQTSPQDGQYANPAEGDSYQMESWSSSSGTGDEEEPDFSSSRFSRRIRCSRTLKGLLKRSVQSRGDSEGIYWFKILHNSLHQLHLKWIFYQ
ncbi:hypothetical protein OJAV_G00071020 [Oryzias javanicus]|uniref:Uncharacterized protein n=1 Tax=Oryzias javanicus TaxID=123683 RepID=A0A437D8G9_ORYJA|nr:hypothetical protein OJAV_G00071020 [Oryzias javanicus]